SRIINVPARGIGEATVDKVAALAAGQKISLWAALARAAEDEALLGAGPRRKVSAFVEMMTRLRAEIASLTPGAAAEKVLEVSGYRDALAAEASMEAEGRTENLLELVDQMREY